MNNLTTSDEIKIACIIYYFKENLKKSATFEEIYEKSGMKKEKLHDVLHSLFEKQVITLINVPDKYESVYTIHYAIKLGINYEIKSLYEKHKEDIKSLHKSYTEFNVTLVSNSGNENNILNFIKNDLSDFVKSKTDNNVEISENIDVKYHVNYAQNYI